MNTSLINSNFISYVVKSRSHFEITSNTQQPFFLGFFFQYMILAIQSVSKRQTIEITYCKNLNAFSRKVERKDGQIRFARSTNIYINFANLAGLYFPHQRFAIQLCSFTN